MKIFDKMQSFFESLGEYIKNFSNLFWIFLGAFLAVSVIIIIITSSAYEFKMTKTIDKINKFLERNPRINDDNLIAFNNMMKASGVPKILRRQWQQFMLYREHPASYYMSFKHCVENPMRNSTYRQQMTVYKVISYVLVVLSFAVSCFMAIDSSRANQVLEDVLIIPACILVLYWLVSMILDLIHSAISGDLFQNYQYFEINLDKAMLTLPEFVDYEVLFSQDEIRRGIPVLFAYLQKRAIQEQQELEKARLKSVDHEKFDFDQAGLDGSLVLDRAMRETENFAAQRKKYMQEIERVNNEISVLENNYKEQTKEFQRQVQTSKETVDNLKEQLEQASSTIEINYIKKQMRDEINRQQMSEKEFDILTDKHNQSIKALNQEISRYDEETKKAKAFLEEAMLSEFNTYSVKVYDNLEKVVDDKMQNKVDGYKEQIKDLEIELEEKNEELENVYARYQEILSQVPAEPVELEQEQQIEVPTKKNKKKKKSKNNPTDEGFVQPEQLDEYVEPQYADYGNEYFDESQQYQDYDNQADLGQYDNQQYDNQDQAYDYNEIAETDYNEEQYGQEESYNDEQYIPTEDYGAENYEQDVNQDYVPVEDYNSSAESYVPTGDGYDSENYVPTEDSYNESYIPTDDNMTDETYVPTDNSFDEAYVPVDDGYSNEEYVPTDSAYSEGGYIPTDDGYADNSYVPVQDENSSTEQDVFNEEYVPMSEEGSQTGNEEYVPLDNYNYENAFDEDDNNVASGDDTTFPTGDYMPQEEYSSQGEYVPQQDEPQEGGLAEFNDSDFDVDFNRTDKSSNDFENMDFDFIFADEQDKQQASTDEQPEEDEQPQTDKQPETENEEELESVDEDFDLNKVLGLYNDDKEDKSESQKDDEDFDLSSILGLAGSDEADKQEDDEEDDGDELVKPESRRKPGRPRKVVDEDEEQKPKRKPGRPRKVVDEDDELKPKRKPGRPRKDDDENPKTGRRGRPRKVVDEDDETEPKRRPGRPRKDDDEKPKTTGRRGRPRKTGTSNSEKPKATTGKRGRPRKTETSSSKYAGEDGVLTKPKRKPGRPRKS